MTKLYSIIITNQWGDIMKKRAILFIESFVVIFLGFTICNVAGIIIEKLIYDVSISFSDIIDLPYLLYGFFSAVLSLAFTAFINRIKK